MVGGRNERRKKGEEGLREKEKEREVVKKGAEGKREKRGRHIRSPLSVHVHHAEYLSRFHRSEKNAGITRVFGGESALYAAVKATAPAIFVERARFQTR